MTEPQQSSADIAGDLYQAVDGYDSRSGKKTGHRRNQDNTARDTADRRRQGGEEGDGNEDELRGEGAQVKMQSEK